MAHKSPKGVNDVQNETTSNLDDQKDDKLVQAVVKLSVNCASTSGDQSTLKEACATNLCVPDDETPVKSFKSRNKTTAVNPPFSGDFLTDMHSIETDFDRRQVQPPLSGNVQSRPPVQQSRHPVQQSEFNAVQWPSLSNSMATTPSTQNSSHETYLSSAPWLSQGLPLDMNIPPSLHHPRVDNTEIPLAFAEQQMSYRTTSTVSSQLSPIWAEGLRSLHPMITSSGTCQPNSNISAHSQFSPISSEDNSQNISVSPLSGRPHMTAQPPPRNVEMEPNNGCNYTEHASGGPGDYGRQLSRSSSTNSLKSFINDDCLVKNLTTTIISYVAHTLQCRDSTVTWKNLVEMYGWDYERTYLFENKLHTDAIFCSLLREPEFQTYSLKQLRIDLSDLPRKDILTDLNAMISKHNALASRRTTQNQLT